ncbi:ATP-grasp enzyme [Trabzonvirus APT65]|uniref:ATP-grasp enzyme n=1 Tax=Aeromonas phage APT65 TaxID=2982914 RepID=A0A9E8GCV3_9CAUD|nr:ATP-grasp enzyme [Aeromonas phage APT65]
MPVQKRIAILPYGPSDSVTALVNSLREIVEENTTVTKLRTEGSIYRGRRDDILVNWGNSSVDMDKFVRIQGAINNEFVLNHPQAIANASNKKKSFELMQESGVKLVEFTTNKADAQAWVDAGGLVYARTKLQGHSGEGIVAVHKQPETVVAAGAAFPVNNVLPNAPLYTKGITVQRREFRIHVFGGEVVYVQQKKRTADFQDNPNYSNVVRNYHTGWIYATNEIRPNAASLAEAKKAVEALGLDFGAVDVITRAEEAWVLEVNTAPGLQGTTLEVYRDAIRNKMNRAAQLPYTARMGARVAVEPEQVADVVEEPVARLVEAIVEAQPEPVQEVAVARVQEAVAPVPPARNPAPAPAAHPNQQGFQLTDGKFYFGTVNGVRTALQYNRGMDCFFMVGWDVPLPKNEVTEIRPAVEA